MWLEIASPHLMRLAFLILLVIVALTACKPTVHDFMLESEQALQPYRTGDVRVAQAALLAEEKVVAKYAAAGTSGFDPHGAYIINYGRRCALHLKLGETNQAHEYFQRVIAQRKLKSFAPTGEITMEALLTSIKEVDATINPKWRQEASGVRMLTPSTSQKGQPP